MGDLAQSPVKFDISLKGGAAGAVSAGDSLYWINKIEAATKGGNPSFLTKLFIKSGAPFIGAISSIPGISDVVREYNAGNERSAAEKAAGATGSFGAAWAGALMGMKMPTLPGKIVGATVLGAGGAVLGEKFMSESMSLMFDRFAPGNVHDSSARPYDEAEQSEQAYRAAQRAKQDEAQIRAGDRIMAEVAALRKEGEKLAPPQTPAVVAQAAREQVIVALKEGGIAALKETAALVGRGAVIKIGRKSENHEAARVEVAMALQNFFIITDPDTAKKLGLKPGEELVLLNRQGEIVDRRLLRRALEVFQSQGGIVVDGKIGPVTLEQLLSSAEAMDNMVGKQVISAVTREHLGGAMNPYSLKMYESNENDPRNQQKLRARQAIESAAGVLVALKDSLDGKKSAGGYTAKEHAALVALFAGAEGKSAPLDPENLTNDGIKALEKAFGLKVDKGVIGPQVALALAQINLRLNNGELVDPSDISAAIALHTHKAAQAKQV